MSTYRDYDDDYNSDDDFEEERHRPKKRPRVIIKKLDDDDDDDDDFEEPPNKQPRVIIKKLDDDDEPPDNPEDYWKNLKPSTYAKNLEEYFKSLHDDEKEKEYWKLHPKKMSEEEKEENLKRGVDVERQSPAMYKVSDSKRVQKWSEMLNRYANEKNIFVGFTSSIGKDRDIWEIWDNYEQIVLITAFNAHDINLGLLPMGEEPATKWGGHSTLLIFFPKKKQLYSYDSSGWLDSFDKIERMINNDEDISSSLRTLLNDEVFEVAGWYKHIRTMMAQEKDDELSGACATFACWYAMWSVLYPEAVLENYNPPPFPGGVHTFLSYMMWCLKLGKIVLPDKKIIQAVTYRGEEGWGQIGKLSSRPLIKKRNRLNYLLQSLTV